jgi:hypothetical protein
VSEKARSWSENKNLINDSFKCSFQVAPPQEYFFPTSGGYYGHLNVPFWPQQRHNREPSEKWQFLAGSWVLKRNFFSLDQKGEGRLIRGFSFIYRTGARPDDDQGFHEIETIPLNSGLSWDSSPNSKNSRLQPKWSEVTWGSSRENLRKCSIKLSRQQNTGINQSKSNSLLTLGEQPNTNKYSLKESWAINNYEGSQKKFSISFSEGIRKKHNYYSFPRDLEFREKGLENSQSIIQGS